MQLDKCFLLFTYFLHISSVGHFVRVKAEDLPNRHHSKAFLGYLLIDSEMIVLCCCAWLFSLSIVVEPYSFLYNVKKIFVSLESLVFHFILCAPFDILVSESLFIHMWNQ